MKRLFGLYELETCGPILLHGLNKLNIELCDCMYVEIVVAGDSYT